MIFPCRGLYAITPDGLPAEILLPQVEAALQGGVAVVQYREKNEQLRHATAQSIPGLCVISITSLYSSMTITN